MTPFEPLARPVPRLEREIDDGLSFSEWPGRRGPLVCLADPLGSLPELASALAAELAPEWRVLQLSPRPELPYQAQAAELLRLLDTFGFLPGSVLLGSGLAAALSLLVAAWYPSRLAGLVLVNFRPRLTRASRVQIAALAAGQPAWRAWLDAPPAWRRLEAQVRCPVLRVRVRGHGQGRGRGGAKAGPRLVALGQDLDPGLDLHLDLDLDATRTFLDSRVQSGPCC